LVGNDNSGSSLRFSNVGNWKEDSFVHFVTFGNNILVAFRVVYVEARLKFSDVKTHQNQNGTRQRRHLRHRRAALAQVCFGVKLQP
jgi:hypothetical protein